MLAETVGKLDAETRFSLPFRLDKGSAKSLEATIGTFLVQKNGPGLIIHIDKNAFVFTKLFFLKRIVHLFYRQKVPLGIWGLPFCVMQQILGGYLYTKVQKFLIKEPRSFAFKYQGGLHSSLLIECKKCIKAETCSGLGNLACNRSQFAWRMANRYRFVNLPYLTLQKPAAEVHDQFIRHICRYPQEGTDRAVAYARVFSKSRGFIYHDRFIYYCNYLLSSEAEDEKKLILAHTKNQGFIENFFRLYPSYFERYAYSLAYGEKIRETVYGFFIDASQAKDLLGKLSLDLQQQSFEGPFYFFGIDLIDGVPDAYKLYAKITDKPAFFDYLEHQFSIVFPPEILEISYGFLFVRRVDSEKRLLSIKVEMYSRDITKLSDLIHKHYHIRLESNEHFETDRVAFDIDLRGRLNKITLYYSYG